LLWSEDFSHLKLIIQKLLLDLVLKGRDFSLFCSDFGGLCGRVRKEQVKAIPFVQELIPQSPDVLKIAALNRFYLFSLFAGQVEVFGEPKGGLPSHSMAVHMLLRLCLREVKHSQRQGEENGGSGLHFFPCPP